MATSCRRACGQWAADIWQLALFMSHMLNLIAHELKRMEQGITSPQRQENMHLFSARCRLVLEGLGCGAQINFL